MNIILGKESYQQLKDRYILLKLDTFLIDKQEMPSYCVIDAKDLPLTEMQDVMHWQNNHNKILENYYKRNWYFCEQMIEHCRQRWAGQLETFYIDLYTRIQQFKTQELDNNWTGYLERNT